MNLNEIQERINKLLSFFVAEVKGATAMGRADINRVSEVVLIPLLSKVFGYPGLINLNQTEKVNHPAIDLGDPVARVAFQVTSTSNSTKVKETLAKFVSHELYRKYDRLIIYNLAEKQGSYSGEGFDDIIQGRFKFDKDRDIIDYSDVLKTVSFFQIGDALDVLRMLEANFSMGAFSFWDKSSLREVARPRRAADYSGKPSLAETALLEEANTFTGRAEMRDIFRAVLTEAEPASHVLNLFGMGGIGKTSIIKDFRRICIGDGVKHAYIDMSENDGISTVVARGAQLLSEQGIELSSYESCLARYSAIREKLTGELRQDGELLVLLKESLAQGGKVDLAPIPAGSILPASLSAIYRILDYEDAAFFIQPSGSLTEALVEDINRHLRHDRLVLFFDTYEVAGTWFDHWLYTSVVQKLASSALLVVAGRQPLSRIWDAGLVRRIKVDALSQDESAALLREHGVGDADLITAIVTWTGGIPLALVLSIELLQRSPDEVKSLAPVYESDVVETLVRILTRAADPTLKHALHVCAVLRFFNLDVLSFMMPGEDLGVLFDKIKRLDFVIHRVDRGWSIHDRVREYLNYELRASSPSAFKRLNAEAAEYFRQKEAESREYSTDWRAHVIERLLHVLSYDVDLGLAQVGELFQKVTNWWQYEFGQNLLEAVKSCEAGSPRISQSVRFLEGQLSYLQAHLTESLDTFRGLLALPDLEPNLRPAVILFLGRSLFYQGELTQALLTFEQASRAAELRHDTQNLAYARAFISLSQYRVGRFKSALAEATTALGIQQSIGDFHGQGRTFCTMGEIHLACGRTDVAGTYLHDSLAIQQRQHNDYEIGYTLRCLAKLSALRGELHQAESLLREALSCIRRVGNRYREAVTLSYLADTYLAGGSYTQAFETYEESSKIADRQQNYFELAYCLCGVVDTYLAAGLFEQLSASLDSGLSLCAGKSYKLSMGRLLVAQGLLYVIKGDVDRAGESCAQGLRAGLDHNPFSLDTLIARLLSGFTLHSVPGDIQGAVIEFILTYWDAEQLSPTEESFRREEQNTNRMLADQLQHPAQADMHRAVTLM
jgi:tetratricopeptide (TPR) repeat protein